MKKLLWASSILGLATAVCFADTVETSTITATLPGNKESACTTLKTACQVAGFTKEGHAKDNKGLFEDCVEPILAGQSISGIMVDPAIIATCKASSANRQQKESRNEGTVPSKAQPQNTPSQGQ